MAVRFGVLCALLAAALLVGHDHILFDHADCLHDALQSECAKGKVFSAKETGMPSEPELSVLGIAVVALYDVARHEVERGAVLAGHGLMFGDLPPPAYFVSAPAASSPAFVPFFFSVFFIAAVLVSRCSISSVRVHGAQSACSNGRVYAADKSSLTYGCHEGGFFMETLRRGTPCL